MNLYVMNYKIIEMSNRGLVCRSTRDDVCNVDG